DGTWPGVVLTAGIEQGVPALADADAVAGVLAAAVRIAVSGDWNRIKICPADDCRWAFYDRSRNRSRTWCSMQVCGNRQKARSWRARARDARA
ncbi:MAG: CGNR zinc finger domain-containing protein, partial [Pseudonocardiaceae bacterium]